MKSLFWGIICLVLFTFALPGCGERDSAKDFLLIRPGVTWYYDVDIQGEKMEMHVETSEHESQGVRFKLKEDRWYVNRLGMVKEVLYDEDGNEFLIAVLKKLEK